MKALIPPLLSFLPSCFQFLEEMAWCTPAGSLSAAQLLPLIKLPSGAELTSLSQPFIFSLPALEGKRFDGSTPPVH